jgi:hypothetical protein
LTAGAPTAPLALLVQQALDPLDFPGGARLEDGQRRAARHQQIHYFLLAMIDRG